MNAETRRLLLSGAILLSLLSLPMTWMTIHDPEVTGGFGGMLPLAGLSLDVTGLNGHVNFLVQTPLWFVVCVIAGASVMEWMHYGGVAKIPRPVVLMVGGAGLVWVGIAILTALGSGKASLGLGSILALAGAVLCLSSVMNPGSQDSDRTSPGAG